MLSDRIGETAAHARRRVAAAALLLAALSLPRAAAGADQAGPAGAGAEDPAPPLPSLLLLPPEPEDRRPRLEAVAAHPDVDRVVFYVGGREVGSDRRRPFSVKLRKGLFPGGDAAEAPALRAVAYDRDGAVLGEDFLDLGRSAARGALTAHPFDVSLRSIGGDPAAGAVEVEVGLSVPPDGVLERIEVFHNERRAAVLAGPPLRIRVPTPGAGPADYLRVVAHLEDGRSLEDAAPLYAEDLGERLEVSLVNLTAVVTDRRGEPVQGLGPADFRVLLGGRELPVERFWEAGRTEGPTADGDHRVPLALGLLVDSSESMATIIGETKEAARRFLEGTLGPGDEAFLVDVDTVPRLVRGMTPSPDELTTAFADLEPGGNTALYDAILLGLSRLERHGGRRALVVLTDGQDFGSDFGPRRCLRQAERTGVPVYVVSLARMGGRTNPPRNLRLEGLARGTGGRVLDAATQAGVERAYEAIERELRSQYVLGVAAGRVLGADELRSLEVEVARPHAEIRTTRAVEGR